MKNMLKKGMGMLIVFSLLLGVLAVQGQKAEAKINMKKIQILGHTKTIEKGKTVDFILNLPREAKSNKVKWSLSNTKVAKITSSFDLTKNKYEPLLEPSVHVKGIKAGKTTLLCKLDGKIYKYNITIINKMPKLSKGKLNITVGKTATLKVKNTSKKVSWKVLSGKNNISLKKKGKTGAVIKGKKKGSAKVQAKAAGQTLTCKVTVKAVSKPASQPSNKPNNQPTAQPTNAPSSQPTVTPPSMPSQTPTAQPTQTPSQTPSANPTEQPGTTETPSQTQTPTFNEEEWKGKEPGLYDSETKGLKKSWNALIAEGILSVEQGVVRRGISVEDDEDGRLVGVLVIKDGVGSIKDYAFHYCHSMEGIIMPNSVTSIGSHAFNSCTGLQFLNIPETVARIERETFSGCSKLTNVIIPEGVTNIGEGAFDGCSELTSIVIPKTVTSIEGSAFTLCSKLTNVIISEGVTNIGEGAFDRCGDLTSIVIPESIASIGDCAFMDCGLIEVIFNGNKDNIKIGEYAFSNTPWGEANGYETIIG